mgnify:FL=1|jgi:LPXTG-motif cell wall-anchored protein
MKPKISNKTLGLIGVALATLTTVYGVKKRKEIKHKTEGAKEKGALALHNRIGMPIYRYLQKKNNIPF